MIFIWSYIGKPLNMVIFYLQLYLTELFRFAYYQISPATNIQDSLTYISSLWVDARRVLQKTGFWYDQVLVRNNVVIFVRLEMYILIICVLNTFVYTKMLLFLRLIYFLYVSTDSFAIKYSHSSIILVIITERSQYINVPSSGIIRGKYSSSSSFNTINVLLLFESRVNRSPLID